MALSWLGDEPIPADLTDDPIPPDVLAALRELPEEDRPGRWQIANDDEAEWAMRKLAEAEMAKAIATARRDSWTSRIVKWWEAQVAGPVHDAQFFAGLLTTYGRHERAEEDRKTINLPSGVVSSRGATDPVVEIADQALVVAWLDDNLVHELGEAIETVVDEAAKEPEPLTVHSLVAPVIRAYLERAAEQMSRSALVSKVREQVAIAETERVVRWKARLVCEHLIGSTEETPPAVGSALHCSECGSTRKVENVAADTEVDRKVVDRESGAVVAGLAIKDPEPTFTVKPAL